MATTQFNITDGARLRFYGNTGQTWSQVHDAATAQSEIADGQVSLQAETGATVFDLNRYIITFDTSTIPDNATITSAFLRIVGTGKQDAHTETINVVGSTPADSTNIAVADYDQLGTTVFGTVAIASFNASGNNDITLNASGLAAISKTGYTNLGLTVTADTTDTAPVSDGFDYITSTKASNLLSVTYSLPTTGGDYFHFM